MNKTLKNVIGVAVIVVLLAADAVFFLFARTYQDSVRDLAMRQFYVSGEGEVVALPDVATFSFAVISEGKKLAELQRENGRKADTLISFLKDQGITAEDIKTANYSVYPNYSYPNCPTSNSGDCPPPKIIGYTIDKSYRVKIKDLARVNAIVEGVVSRNADNVSELSFTIDDPTAVEAEARVKAIAKAQEKAQQIAKEAGFIVGRLLSINETSTPWRENYVMAARGGGSPGMAADMAPTIEPGSQEVSVSVELTYEIR